MAWTYNNIIIREGRAWVDADGTQHPASWGRWSDEEKQAAGLAQIADAAPFDSRFWWDADTPKALDDKAEIDENGDPILDEKGQQLVTLGLKSQWKAIIKQQAGGLLSATDWYVTRNAETGAAIPADVTAYRAAVRTASNTIEAAIDGAADHAAFVALFDTPLDADGNATGNPPISDWPEE